MKTNECRTCTLDIATLQDETSDTSVQKMMDTIGEENHGLAVN